jgi:hypothetical protein
LKFRAKPVKQLGHLGAKGIFRPCDELTPMILGMLPQDFDHIEFRAVRWQIDKGGVVLDVPAQRDFVINAVMDSGIVENDKNWFGRSDAGEKFINEGDEGVTRDGASGLPMEELPGREIQRAQDGHALMVRWCRHVRLAQRRPRALNGRRSGKSRLVKVDQLTLTFP